MTRRERLTATLNSLPVDRPAVSTCEVGGSGIDPTDPDEFNVFNDPSWLPLLKLNDGCCDIMRMCSPIIKLAPENRYADFITTVDYMKNRSIFTRTTLKVAGRTMTSLIRRDPDVYTVWTIEHLLKDIDDLEAYLQLPDDVFAYDVDASNLFIEDEKLGDKGVIMVSTGDPICFAASLFSMEDYLILALTENDLFHALLDKVSQHIYTITESTARKFPNHLWSIYGPEYATEPYLPPKLFDEYVVRYTKPMLDIIKRYGGFTRIHCHGRIKNILPHIIEMGAMGLDPIEPPPQGDVDLAYIRKEYGRDLVLFGNLEISDIETMNPVEFEKVVHRSLLDGTYGDGKGFVLMPSSFPHGRKVSNLAMTNYETIVRLASNWGRV